MSLYRLRSYAVEAWQFLGLDHPEFASLPSWAAGHTFDKRGEPHLYVRTGTGISTAVPGSWLLHMPNESIEVCHPDAFHARFEEVPL